MIDILNTLISLLMIPLSIILNDITLLLGYIIADVIIILKNPAGFGSLLFLLSFFDFIIAKNIVKDFRGYKQQVDVKEECIGEECNIPALRAAS